MKKIWILLLSIVFIYGCGSGGSTSGTPASSPGSSLVSGQAGTFTITLNEGGAGSSTSKHLLAINANAATKARVVIRKIQLVTTQVPIYNYDGNGDPIGGPIGYQNVTASTETYRKVVDADIIYPIGQVTVNAPVSANGSDTYTFDVLTYIAGTGTPNTMLKFGHKDGIVVTNGGSAALTINDICADPSVSLTDTTKVGSVVMQIPTSIISEQPYSVTTDATTPVKRGYYELGIALSASGTTLTKTNDLSTNPLSISGITRLTAPSTTNLADTSLLFTVKYFISNDMLDQTKKESFQNWERIYPNNVGTSGETLASSFVPFIGVTVPGLN